MNYWIVIDGTQAGPMSLEEILAHPALNPETPVWHDGLPDWTVARLVPEIAVKFHTQADGSNTTPPAPPSPESGEPFHYGNETYGNQQQPHTGNYNSPYNPVQPGGNPYYNGYNANNFYRPGEFMPPDPRNQRPMPSNYLAWAIIVTICCCQIFGIIAIIYAAQVSPAYYRGDYERAEKMSGNAALWVILSVVTGLIVYPFCFLYSIMAFLYSIMAAL